MWECQECGKENRDDRIDCFHCGTAKSGVPLSVNNALDDVRQVTEQPMLPVSPPSHFQDASSISIVNNNMPLSKILFSFKGRISRGTYWVVQVSMIMLGFILGMVIGSLMTIGKGNQDGETAGIIGIIFFILIAIISFWVGLAVGVKRWHDLDVSGWAVLTMIPYIGPIALGCIKGTTGPNKYGPDPL